jgi:hypothetical protein
MADRQSDSDTPPLRKVRTIVTTDGEVDDRCSMIRYLLYCHQFDTQGLIYTSSKYHWKGFKWSGED